MDKSAIKPVEKARLNNKSISARGVDMAKHQQPAEQRYAVHAVRRNGSFTETQLLG